MSLLDGVTRILLLLGVATVLWLLSSSAAPDLPAPRSEPLADETRWRQLLDELAALRRELQDIARREPPRAPPPSGDSPGADGSLAAAVRDLDQRIAVLANAAPAAASVNAALHASPAVQWREWERLSALDHAAARLSVLFSTPREVLQRFGAPSRIDVNGERVLWSYDRPAELSPTGKLQIAVIGFVDGLVLEVQELSN